MPTLATVMAFDDRNIVGLIAAGLFSITSIIHSNASQDSNPQGMPFACML